MYSPLELDLHSSFRRQMLMREAEAERLAQDVAPSSSRLRARLAAALHALACRLDPCVVSHAPAAIATR